MWVSNQPPKKSCDPERDQQQEKTQEHEEHESLPLTDIQTETNEPSGKEGRLCLKTKAESEAASYRCSFKMDGHKNGHSLLRGHLAHIIGALDVE